MLHPPNCNHSHLDKKIFAYLNVPFSIASGKLMVQINYSLKKDKQNIVFVPVRCRFPNGFLFQFIWFVLCVVKPFCYSYTFWYNSRWNYNNRCDFICSFNKVCYSKVNTPIGSLHIIAVAMNAKISPKFK